MAAKFSTCESEKPSSSTKDSVNQLRFQDKEYVEKDGFPSDKETKITLVLPTSTKTCPKSYAVNVEKPCRREEGKVSDEMFQSERKGANSTSVPQSTSNEQKPPLVTDNNRAISRSQSCHFSLRANQERPRLCHTRSQTRNHLESVMVKQFDHEASELHFLAPLSRKSSFVSKQPTTSSQGHCVELPPVSTMDSEDYFVLPARKSKTRSTNKQNISTHHSGNAAVPQADSNQSFAGGWPHEGQRNNYFSNTQQLSGMSRIHKQRRLVAESAHIDDIRDRQQETENVPQMFDKQYLPSIQKTRHLVTRSICEEELNSSQQRPTNVKSLHWNLNAPVVSDKQCLPYIGKDRQSVTRSTDAKATRHRRSMSQACPNRDCSSVEMWKQGIGDIKHGSPLYDVLQAAAVNTEASLDSNSGLERDVDSAIRMPTSLSVASHQSSSGRSAQSNGGRRSPRRRTQTSAEVKRKVCGSLKMKWK